MSDKLSMKVRNLVYVQAGGPTSVINCSAAGLISALNGKESFEGSLFAAVFGIKGLLEKELICLDELSENDIQLLTQTPSMAFGSTRYRPKEGDYDKIFNTLRYYNISHIILNGGNGTIKLAQRLQREINKRNLDHSIIVIPKTVDNDIQGLHHSPGYPSAAQYVVQTTMELHRDIYSYESELIVVVEVMGRNNGWLAASTQLANKYGYGPDLIYVPEQQFNEEDFISNIREVMDEKGKCFIVMAEGIKDSQGQFLFEKKNDFVRNPERNMGGLKYYIENLLHKNFRNKIRVINLDLMQRASIKDTSNIDKEEAFSLGEYAAEQALLGRENILVYTDVKKTDPYVSVNSVKSLDSVVSSHNPLKEDYFNGPIINKNFNEYIEPLLNSFDDFFNMKELKKNV